jgi:hypothetical protein
MCVYIPAVRKESYRPTQHIFFYKETPFQNLYAYCRSDLDRKAKLMSSLGGRPFLGLAHTIKPSQWHPGEQKHYSLHWWTGTCDLFIKSTSGAKIAGVHLRQNRNIVIHSIWNTLNIRKACILYQGNHFIFLPSLIISLLLRILTYSWHYVCFISTMLVKHE